MWPPEGVPEPYSAQMEAAGAPRLDVFGTAVLFKLSNHSDRFYFGCYRSLKAM